MRALLEFKWGISKGKDTAGYNICSLYADGKKVSSCNGGGYDMKATALGDWIANAFEKELLKLKIPFQYINGKKVKTYYGLSFHNPNYDPGKYIPKDTPVFGKDDDVGKSVAQLEKEGKSLGLERYQAFHRASSHVPTKKHTLPQIDGACGFSQVEKILRGLGYKLELVRTSRNRQDIYILKEAGK